MTRTSPELASRSTPAAGRLFPHILFNHLIPKAIEIKDLKIQERPSSSIKDKGNSLSPSKPTRTAGIVRIVRKLPSSPNTYGRSTLTKKARAAGVK
ncbi:hypothetical protein AVEN_124282-1 [Araneus ventricosus]|uniref:Uncharacterized protein n=1 Tax=Araneus ventricosus TaxID=182803 RepID=A0A4Y2KSP0_ARAVE|nr:hypothetical protein AVEN_124282-1 [Araneus ventricosus]